MTEPDRPEKVDSAEQLHMAAAAALKLSKQELRRAMKASLSAIPKSSLDEQSNVVFHSLQKFTPYIKASRVCIYLSMPKGEVQTENIVRHAFSQGKEVFVPYLHKFETSDSTYPKRVMDMVKLRDTNDYESLERDAWGIPTVSQEGLEKRECILQDFGSEILEPRKALELILMPGVAFEKDPTSERTFVRRLGHGKGFYDFFLHRYYELYGHLQGPPGLFGLALKEQLLREEDGLHVPVGPLDHMLQGVLVGDGTVIH